MTIKEKQIIRGITRGNVKDYEYLFKQYYPQMCHLALKYVKDLDTAEEIAQNIFYNIWKKRAELNITSSVKSYLFRSVFNNCLQHIQHQKVVNKYVTEKGDDAQIEFVSPFEELKYNELLHAMNRALDSLPERTRTIFYYSRFEGLKYHEIADKLTISIKTVEANMGKALKHLRYYLSDYTVSAMIILILKIL